MPQWLVIAAGGPVPDAEFRDRLTLLLKASGHPFWHWTDDLWLLGDVPDEIEAEKYGGELHAKLGKFEAGRYLFVLGVRFSTGLYAVVPPDGQPWLSEHWSEITLGALYPAIEKLIQERAAYPPSLPADKERI